MCRLRSTKTLLGVVFFLTLSSVREKNVEMTSTSA